MTYLFLAILACTLALGAWLVVRTDLDVHFHRLPARRDPAAASKAARALTPLLGAGRTPKLPAPVEEPAQWSSPGAGFQPQ